MSPLLPLFLLRRWWMVFFPWDEGKGIAEDVFDGYDEGHGNTGWMEGPGAGAAMPYEGGGTTPSSGTDSPGRVGCGRLPSARLRPDSSGKATREEAQSTFSSSAFRWSEAGAYGVGGGVSSSCESIPALPREKEPLSAIPVLSCTSGNSAKSCGRGRAPHLENASSWGGGGTQTHGRFRSCRSCESRAGCASG